MIGESRQGLYGMSVDMCDAYANTYMYKYMYVGTHDEAPKKRGK